MKRKLKELNKNYRKFFECKIQEEDIEEEPIQLLLYGIYTEILKLNKKIK